MGRVSSGKTHPLFVNENNTPKALYFLNAKAFSLRDPTSVIQMSGSITAVYTRNFTPRFLSLTTCTKCCQ